MCPLSRPTWDLLGQAVCLETGYLVRSCDAEALADALNRCLMHPRQAGLTRAFVEKRYAFAKTLNAFRIGSSSIP